MVTTIIYNGPPSEPVKRVRLVWPDGTVWYTTDQITDEEFIAFGESCKVTVQTIVTELDADQIKS